MCPDGGKATHVVARAVEPCGSGIVPHTQEIGSCVDDDGMPGVAGTKQSTVSGGAGYDPGPRYVGKVGRDDQAGITGHHARGRAVKRLHACHHVIDATAAECVVVTSGWNSGGYGNLVEIRHADGSLTLYAHNQRILVEEGQRVTQGQLIAEMGSTGFSTGPHLHFEIHPAGQGAVNPITYLAQAKR